MSFRIFDDAMRVVIRAVWQIEEGMRQFMANDFPKVPLLVLQPEIGNAQINSTCTVEKVCQEAIFNKSRLP